MSEHQTVVQDDPKTDVAVAKKTGHYVAPPVDIFSTDGGLVLVADLPGVAQEDLDVSVEQAVLTIKGHASHADGSGALKHACKLPSVFRQFRLGDDIDYDNITAELKHGVLQLSLPKAEAAKARKVAVNIS